MQTTSDIANNKMIAQKFLQLVSQENVEELCQMITPTWIMLGGLPNLPPGPEGMRKLFASFGKIEQQWTIEDIIAEGNKVVVRATNTCLQESFFGVPSYGKKQTFTAMFMHHIVDGRIQETWRNADDLGRVLQLGAQLVPSVFN